MGESRRTLDRIKNNLQKLFVIRYSLYLISIFLITFTPLNAQIKIKEKVEIKPVEENIQSDYPLSSFDPCGNYPTEEYHQVVYSCSIYPIEPYQQLFPFQGGGSNSTFNSNRLYQIEIIEGTDYAYMERVAYQDSFGVFHPGEYLGGYLTGIRGNELSGSGNYIALFDPNNPAIQRAGTYLRENPSLYYIHFNSYEQTEADIIVKITDLDSSIVTYWYTKIVNPQLIISNQQLENDTVLHYYSKDVSIKLNNTKFPCLHPGYGGCPPDNVTFNIEITQGQQYGIIKNSQTDETNTSFTGLSWEEIRNTIFTYYANGLQPDSTATVRIRHSSSDAEITPMEYEFTVKRNTIPAPSEGGAIYIQLDKKEAMPSDTVEIYLKWINETGDTLEFAPIQRFQIELAEGAEYGRLVDVESGQEGDNFSNAARELKLIIEDEIQKELAKITIVAQCDLLIWGGRTTITGGSVKLKEREEEATERNKGKEPITPEFIIVGDHLVGVEEVIINKTPIIVEIVPEVISAGDTARIKIKRKLNDGSIVEYPSEQQFEIGMLEGCLLGKISSEGTDTNYLYGIRQPIYFIADSSADSGVVKIRVGLIDSNTTGNKSNKGKITTEAGEYCFLNNFESVIYKDAEVRVENVIEILLGETKYFGVKKKTETGELKIEEIKTEYGNEPQFPADADGWEWQKTDVWGSEPVSVVDCDSCGEKMGIYWEKKYPKYGNRTYENGKYAGRNFIGMGQLRTGLVRIVGRFWKPDSTYIIKLRAVFGDDTVYKKIVINSPVALKDSEQTPAFKYYKDVNDSLWNIDSLCILYGGELGIPPHFIKGHAFREASHIDSVFTPSFRYEPYTIQYWPTLKDAAGRFYFKDSASVDYSDVPQHQNVNYMDYIREVKTVWNIIEEYSQLVHINNPTQYGKRNTDHTMNFYPKFFKGIQDQYDKFLKYFENLKKLTRPTSADSANVAMINWFKKDWTKNEKKAEPEKKIAHTRAASSYGLLQMLYTTALWKLKTYIQNKVPEEMNENIFFLQSLIYQKNKLKKYLGSSTESGNNWSDGYEMSFVKSIFDAWNESEGYGKDIITKSTRFLPK